MFQIRQTMINKLERWCLLPLLYIAIIASLNACGASADIPSAEAAYVSWTGVRPFVRPVWSPDGTKLVLEESRDPSVMIDNHLALYTLKDEQLTPLTYTLGYYTSVSWSADSSKLAVARVNDRVYGKDNKGQDIQVIDLTTKQIKTIGLGDGVAWAPDAQHIAIYVGPNPNTHLGPFAINIVRPDGTLLKTIPLPIMPTPPGPTPAPAPPAPGQLFNIPPSPSEDLFNGMSWSPDSQQIVFSVMHQSAGSLTGDLYIVGINGNEFRQITSEGWNHEPAWSPDGKTIAYIKELQPIFGRIYFMRPDGSCSLPVSDKITASSLSWSPDNSKIVYEDGRDVYILDVQKKLASGTTPYSSCP
jgi:Tol biopolymer transport system component